MNIFPVVSRGGCLWNPFPALSSTPCTSSHRPIERERERTNEQSIGQRVPSVSERFLPNLLKIAWRRRWHKQTPLWVNTVEQLLHYMHVVSSPSVCVSSCTHWNVLHFRLSLIFIALWTNTRTRILLSRPVVRESIWQGYKGTDWERHTERESV